MLKNFFLEQNKVFNEIFTDPFSVIKYAMANNDYQLDRL